MCFQDVMAAYQSNSPWVCSFKNLAQIWLPGLNPHTKALLSLTDLTNQACLARGSGGMDLLAEGFLYMYHRNPAL